MRASEIYETAVEDLKNRLPKLKSHTYDSIDNLMQDISFRHRITGKKLHDLFVHKYGHTPDTWIKKLKDRLEEQGSESDAYGNTGEKHECGSCDGTGIVSYDELAKAAEYDDVCPECGGKGWVRDKESLKKKGVAEGLDEAVGGNYLYHATGGLKEILQSGAINAARGPQDSTKAQTKLPTVSTTRDWGYASGSNASAQDGGGISRGAVIVLDRNAVEQKYKTLGTSQSRDNRGLAFPKAGNLKAGQAARSYDTDQSGNLTKADADDVFAKGTIAFGGKPVSRQEVGQQLGQAKHDYYAPKAGGEFEEAVVVPKGSLPIQGTMVGFWINPRGPLAKDPTIMNDPRRLDMVRPNQFVKATQTQGVAEDWQKVNKSDKTDGMSGKAVSAYRRENPGSKLKTAVTTKPSKLKPGSKAAKRRKSFCARMGGNKGPMKKPNGKPTPKALALRRWNCESVEELEKLVMIAEQKINEAKNLKQQAAITIVKKQSVTEMDKSQTPPGRDGSNDSDAGKKEYTAKTTTAKTVAKDGEKTLNKIFKDTPKKKVSESVDNADQLQQIKDFINWSMKTLNMQKPYPKFTLSRNTQQAQKGHHTGLHHGDTIWVYIENRNLVDIFRTIFHELVHHRQDQLDMIKDGDSYPGSPIEALADMMAGKYIKIYGKDHPEIFQ